MFEAITHGIFVKVKPTYLQEHSDAEDFSYVWACSITVVNQSEQAVQAPFGNICGHPCSGFIPEPFSSRFRNKCGIGGRIMRRPFVKFQSIPVGCRGDASYSL